jgi:GNAT superfamily N-acetyltransferase
MTRFMVDHHAAAFLQQAAPLLEADPYTTNVIRLASEHLRAGERLPQATDRWITVIDSSGVLGVAFWSPPHRLCLSAMPVVQAEALAVWLGASGSKELGTDPATISGVTGPADVAAAFARRWTRCFGVPSALDTTARMLVLPGRLAAVALRGAPGAARVAAMDDLELVATWFAAFEQEAVPHEPPVAAGRVARMLQAGRVWLWCAEAPGETEGRAEAGAAGDAPPVALAGWHWAPGAMARIGPVYTPPAQRGRGFASALTAAVARQCAERNAPGVVLYADATNAVANRVYERLGFVAHHDHAQWRFGG